MESRKKAEILARLSELETEYQMRILAAVECGSHAYGYASEDSDYDIRLIYVYPMERYLSLSSPKDSIRMMEGDLDISGWELKRTLSHAAKSNATFWEWVQSPVILDRLRFMEQLKSTARPYFAEKPILYANREMLQSFRKEVISGRKQAKNCLGIMRTAMQAIYTMQYHTAPPVDIVMLINQTVLPGTQDAEECRELLKLCKSGHKDAPYTLTCELASSIDDRIRLWLSKHPKQEKRDLKTLDEFFRSAVLR